MSSGHTMPSNNEAVLAHLTQYCKTASVHQEQLTSAPLKEMCLRHFQ